MVPMNAHEVLAAWKEAQACETPGFYEKFGHLTGLRRELVEQRFRLWKMLPHDTAVAIAERQGVSVREGGFQAYLVEVFWNPPDERAHLSRKIAQYLRLCAEDGADPADEVDNILDCEQRIGRPPIPFALAEGGPSGSGDPREHKPWPPEEDCPTCPGQTGDNDTHKLSCSSQGAVLKLPARIDADGKVHLDILTPKEVA